MKLLKLYSWLAGTMNDFTTPFENDETLYNQATSFWHKLDNSSIVFVIAMVVLGITFAFFYYVPFNNQPGRKYTPKWWSIMCGVTALVTFLFTLGWEYLSVKPTMQGAWGAEFKVALCNAIYAAGVYFVASVIICWSGRLKTNAYKLFK